MTILECGDGGLKMVVGFVCAHGGKDGRCVVG